MAGPPAPWHDVVARDRQFSTGDVVAAFANLGPPQRSPHDDDRRWLGAAVLAALYDQDDEATIILTRRTIELRAHSGEISFPGGRREPGETLAQTALRETVEEIGLAQEVRLVGELDHLSTISSGSAIVPFVGILDAPPVGLAPNPGEVDAILHVPLRTLLDPAIYRSEVWQLPGDMAHPIFVFDLDEDTIWGATAAMLRQLLGFLTGTVDRGQLGHI